MYNPNYIDWAPQGWRCPVCGRVYSPTTPMCFYCSNQEGTVQTTGTSINDSEWWEEYLKRSSTAKTTKDINDLIKSTADVANIINPTTTWKDNNINSATTTSNPNVKVTAWNSSTTCEQDCESCDKYEKSCFGGIETTSTKAIISHKKSPEIIFRDGIWWEKYKEE